jgi:hypothetical protein
LGWSAWSGNGTELQPQAAPVAASRPVQRCAWSVSTPMSGHSSARESTGSEVGAATKSPATLVTSSLVPTLTTLSMRSPGVVAQISGTAAQAS